MFRASYAYTCSADGGAPQSGLVERVGSFEVRRPGALQNVGLHV